jgi:hypothetical protein
MKDSFLDWLIGCIVVVLHLILCEPKQMVVKWMGEKLPAVLLNPSMSSEGPHIVVLQDDLFPPCLPRIFVMPCTLKLLDHLKMMISIDGFPLWQKLDQ